jgi:hypothetical protein
VSPGWYPATAYARPLETVDRKGADMSVLVTMRVSGDTDKFREFVAREPDRLRKIADAARASGCIHHRFGVGDGYVVVVDEWETADAFQQFFKTNPDIPDVMRDAGAQGEPEFDFTDAVETADQF